jgi:hypothetical protein
VQAHSVNLSDLANQHRSSENISAVGSVAVGGTMSKGLKSLTKEGRHLLEGYQNLFYLLQTRPQYLSKLLFCLPHSKSMHFLQNVIFSLYNFGSNPRDEYLLLKQLRSALEEEIRYHILALIVFFSSFVFVGVGVASTIIVIVIPTINYLYNILSITCKSCHVLTF